jgi:TPP-dependent indolepyruvate ferredoxin oxidoreductase alpha subunit
MAKFVVIRRCFWNNVLFREGEVVSLPGHDKPPCKHFEPVDGGPLKVKTTSEDGKPLPYSKWPYKELRARVQEVEKDLQRFGIIVHGKSAEDYAQALEALDRKKQAPPIIKE